MTTSDDAVAMAGSAADAIRVLNQATRPAAGWPGLAEPVDVYEVLGSLASLADRLQQTASQLARFLEHRLHGGRLDVAFGTHSEDPAAAVSAAADTLESARVVAGQLAQLFSDAQATVIAMVPSDAEATGPSGTEAIVSSDTEAPPGNAQNSPAGDDDHD